MVQQTPSAFARSQQLLGIPEHPCETTFRNGCLVCPYEEMEVQFFQKHAGLYLIPLLGEPFELFGRDGYRADQRWESDRLPVAIHSTVQLGCRVSVSVFDSLLDTDRVVTGEEPLIQFVRYQIVNQTGAALDLPLTLVAASCFRPPIESDGDWDKFYWKNFLGRDDIYEILSEEREPHPYLFDLKQEGNSLVTSDGDIFLTADAGCPGFTYYESYGDGTWAEGKHFQKGIRFMLHLGTGQTETVTVKIPYLPLKARKRQALEALTWDTAHQKVATLWNEWLANSSQLTVPGTKLHELWNQQTAATLMLVDRQNKGADTLYGREQIKQWGTGYPDRILCYPHLSNALYEFIWAQESMYWVVDMLDRQGFHKQAEEYFEVIFALQGSTTPGVHDPSILPPAEVGRAFTGTTIHAWLNSNGAVLGAIANHYRLTRNKAWILEHLDDILSSLRWFEHVRNSTKTPEFAAIHGYGLMPPGQSTDSDYISTHVQWFYTDTWTLDGVYSIAEALVECGVPEGAHFMAEAEDYRDCFLRTIDASIIDVEELPEDPAAYDFSAYLYNGPLERDRIDKFDERGIPLILKEDILTRTSAKELGLHYYLHASTVCAVPLKRRYLCNDWNMTLGLLYRFIDFSSDKPLFDGARYSGKVVWQAIMEMLNMLDHADFGTDGAAYNEYLLLPHTAMNNPEAYEEILEFTLRYACDPETHMTVEQFGINTREQWFQPCPFALSMANLRRMLHRSLLFENAANGRLELCKMLPKRYVENTITYEKPVLLQNAATDFGHLSVSYRANAILNEIGIEVEFAEPERLPDFTDIYFRHPQKKVPVRVTVNGKDTAFDAEKVSVSTANGDVRKLKITAYFE